MRSFPSVRRLTLSLLPRGKQFLALTLATASMFVVLSCGGDKSPTAPPPPVMVLTTVAVSLSSSTIQVGQAATASATGADQNGGSIATGTISWSSASTAVANVSSSGAITAVAPGQTIITASAGGKSGQATLTVIPVPVATVTVSPATASLIIGATQQLTAATLDAGNAALTGRTVTWSSSDAAKASVSSSGLVTALAAGSATITATSEGKSAQATITVLPVPVATVTISPATASITVAGTQQFTATLKDASGNTLTGRTVTWSTSAASVATVGSSTGLATAVAAGTATITATSEGKSATATLTVVAAGAVCSSAPQLGCGLALDQFALVAAGSFQMGSNLNPGTNETPAHAVTLTRSFYMQKTEVTQGQWRAVMGSNPSAASTCGDTCPVESVSWNDIQTFLTTLNAQNPGVTYRLPTEAEWEYSARAGTTSELYGAIDAIAWTSENSSARPHAVGGKLANAWGLFDMIGNVWEWVNDRDGPYPSGPVTDPTGPTTGSFRVERGGSWFNIAYYARAAGRNWDPPTASYSDTGFRLVRVVP